MLSQVQILLILWGKAKGRTLIRAGKLLLDMLPQDA